MYDHDQEDLEVLGWEEFVLRQWQSIFVGYRSNAGLRTLGRRWSDLFEAGLGCSQEVADLLVRAELMERADRHLLVAIDPAAVLAGMAGVLAEVRLAIEQFPGFDSGRREAMLREHARLTTALIFDDADDEA